MSHAAVADIRDIIQTAYGDASQTALDDRCAQAIVEYLGQAGWASPEFVRALVASAGGTIELADNHLVDPPDLLMVEDDRGASTRRVSVKRSARAGRR